MRGAFANSSDGEFFAHSRGARTSDKIIRNQIFAN